MSNSEIETLLREKTQLQAQLLAAQEEIIRLQAELAACKPATPEDDVFWNKVSGGLSVEKTLESNDLLLVQQLNDWYLAFGRKYLKPYVHTHAYIEIMAHAMRGLAQRLAELEVLAEFGLDSPPDD